MLGQTSPMPWIKGLNVNITIVAYVFIINKNISHKNKKSNRVVPLHIFPIETKDNVAFLIMKLLQERLQKICTKSQVLHPAGVQVNERHAIIVQKQQIHHLPVRIRANLYGAH